MPRRKKVQEQEEQPRKFRMGKWTPNKVALMVIFIIAAADVYLNAHPLNWLVLALLGAYVGYGNVKEVDFLVPVITLVLVSLSVGALGGELLAPFLLNLSMAFGAAGIVVSLGLLIRVLWK